MSLELNENSPSYLLHINYDESKLLLREVNKTRENGQIKFTG